MGILTGKTEGIKQLNHADIAFIATLSDYAKGMSTRSLPPTDHYTLEFEQINQIRGPILENEEPHFHYMQTGSGGQVLDAKTGKMIPAPEPKRPKLGQLYLALLNEPQQIKQLVEIIEDDIDELQQAAAKPPY